MSLPIRVGIVDDHPGVRIGIRNLLLRSNDIEVVGEGENGEDAINLVNKTNPDILLLDVELPVLRGDLVMQQLRENKSDVKVLAVSSYNDPIYVKGMLENGAAGYITKEEAPGMLLEAVHSIFLDEVKWISPSVAKKTSNIMLDNVSFNGIELEILRLILLGRNNPEIRQTLKLNERELKQRIEGVMDKLKVSSREELKETAGCILSTVTMECAD